MIYITQASTVTLTCSANHKDGKTIIKQDLMEHSWHTLLFDHQNFEKNWHSLSFDHQTMNTTVIVNHLIILVILYHSMGTSGTLYHLII